MKFKEFLNESVKIIYNGVGDKDYKILYKDIVNFFLDKLKIENIQIELKILKPNLSNRTFGYIKLGQKIPKKFKVNVEDAHFDLIIKMIIHELIHVKQISKKEIIMSSDGDVIWKGKNYGKNIDKTHSTNPWEVEVVNKQESLINSYLNSKTFKKLKETNATIKFITE